jgi:hypothetical protein
MGARWICRPRLSLPAMKPVLSMKFNLRTAVEPAPMLFSSMLARV